jgi:hypothetical protein
MMRSGRTSQNPSGDSSNTYYRGIVLRIHPFSQKGETMRIARAFVCVLSIVAAVTVTAEAGTAFTYQGKLNDGGNPANGSYSLSFTLFSALTGGSQVGPVVAKTVTITNGYFTTELDFGIVFTGSDRWLEIKVGSTTLSPRQKVNPTPYAQYAFNSSISDSLDMPFFGSINGKCTALKITNATSNILTDPRDCTLVAGEFESTNAGRTNRGVVGRGAGTKGIGVIGECSGSNNQGWLGGIEYGVKSVGDLVVEPISGGVEGRINFQSSTGGHMARISSAPNLLSFSGGDDSWDLRIQDRFVGIWGQVYIYGVNSGNIVLRLGEGLDYAEGFDVSAKQETGPGTVLVIDPENPGKLALSTEAYDRKVAGIVAGAKGLGSGVRLGGEQFDKDVALAGRVYCNVDATKEAVRPGDLLTTSATPGHAMKVTDYGKAQGAILGKAMENLEQGKKGQILVLVTLQ